MALSVTFMMYHKALVVADNEVVRTSTSIYFGNAERLLLHNDDLVGHSGFWE